jgi:hypothetical protein
LQFEASLGKQLTRPYLEKSQHKTGLVEWPSKCEALSSSPSTAKKKLNYSYIAGGIRQIIRLLWKNLTLSLKNKHVATAKTGFYPREIKLYLYKNLYINDYSIFVHNSKTNKQTNKQQNVLQR